jgi:hypothetical protein
MGKVQGEGLRADKTVLMSTGTGTPLMHQEMDSLHTKSQGCCSNHYMAAASTSSAV